MQASYVMRVLYLHICSQACFDLAMNLHSKPTLAFVRLVCIWPSDFYLAEYAGCERHGMGVAVMNSGLDRLCYTLKICVEQNE